MTTTEVMMIVKDRGLDIVLREGRPILIGRPPAVTDALLSVLKIHRERIIALLKPKENK